MSWIWPSGKIEAPEDAVEQVPNDENPFQILNNDEDNDEEEANDENEEEEDELDGYDDNEEEEDDEPDGYEEEPNVKENNEDIETQIEELLDDLVALPEDNISNDSEKEED